MDNNNNSSTGIESKYSRQLYLNSKYANYTNDTIKNSQVTFNLNEPINVPVGKQAYCSVVSAEIPNTIFSVDNSTTINVVATKPSFLINITNTTATTNIITYVPVAGTIYPGMTLIVGTSIGNLVAGTIYYVITTPSTTTFTVSAAYNTGAFALATAAASVYASINCISQITSTSSDGSFFTILNTTTTSGFTKGNNISFVGTPFATIPAGTTYVIYSILSGTTFQVATLAAPNTPYAFATGSGTMYVATNTTQTFAITGNSIINGSSSNLYLTTGNYSSSVYNTNNPTSLAAQMSKVLTFSNDNNTNDTITLVCYYGIAQSKFYLGFYPTKAYYSIFINSPIFGFNSQTFPQLTTSSAIIGNVNANATTQTTFNLLIGNTIPRFFPPYVIIGSNLQSKNQAVGETKVSTLAKIVVDVPYNSFIFYRNFYGYSNFISNREIFSVELTMLDEAGAVVNMQGAPWSITLQIDFN